MSAFTVDTTADALASGSLDVLRAASAVAVGVLRLVAGALLEHGIGSTVLRTDARI